ncbi:MAG: SDR family NAD(P)-dependent oxidoreductase, partial [Planctomycetota bacterium]
MESELFDLTGKTALITGAGRGIGLAIARGLAQHGADVVLAARSEGQLKTARARIEAETSRRAHVLPVDLANLDHIDSFFARVLQAADGVDILVNCAGMTVRGPSEKVSIETSALGPRTVMPAQLTRMSTPPAACRTLVKKLSMWSR